MRRGSGRADIVGPWAARQASDRMAPAVTVLVLLLLVGLNSGATLLLPEPLQTRPLFSGRAQQTMCVDIPRNLSLCYGVGYTTMRLPNLLEHDTMEEVSQQSSSWLPLMHIGCHPDAQLFLCSLFSPVCLEKDIWPCRSLCRTVQRGCEGQMLGHGFPWPDIFRCDRFPVDNDMCILAQNPDPESRAEAAAAMAAAGHDADSADNAAPVPPSVPTNAQQALLHFKGSLNRNVCSQPSTYESVEEHLCRSDIVVRGRVKPASRSLGHVELLKGPSNHKQRRHAVVQLGRPMALEESCGEWLEQGRAYLIAGHSVRGQRRRRGHVGKAVRHLKPTIVVPWAAAAKEVKKAIAALGNDTKCTKGKNIFFEPAIKFKLPLRNHSQRRAKVPTAKTNAAANTSISAQSDPRISTTKSSSQTISVPTAAPPHPMVEVVMMPRTPQQTNSTTSPPTPASDTLTSPAINNSTSAATLAEITTTSTTIVSSTRNSTTSALITSAFTVVTPKTTPTIPTSTPTMKSTVTRLHSRRPTSSSYLRRQHTPHLRRTSSSAVTSPRTQKPLSIASTTASTISSTPTFVLVEAQQPTEDTPSAHNGTTTSTTTVTAPKLDLAPLSSTSVRSFSNTLVPTESTTSTPTKKKKKKRPSERKKGSPTRTTPSASRRLSLSVSPTLL